MTVQDRGHEQKMLTTYLLRPGSFDQATDVLERHWPTLRRKGLVTGEPSWIAQGSGDDGPFVVELVTWGVPDAVDRAYLDPEVNSIWQEMFALTESRGARPPVDWPAVTQLAGGPAHTAAGGTVVQTLTAYQVREGHTGRAGRAADPLLGGAASGGPARPRSRTPAVRGREPARPLPRRAPRLERPEGPGEGHRRHRRRRTVRTGRGAGRGAR
ncbi:hypothetical protein ACFQ10_01340 [Streptomyces indonesiensis]